MAIIIGYNRHQGSKWPQIGLGLGIFLLILLAIVLANVFAAQNKPEKNKPVAKTTTSSTTTTSTISTTTSTSSTVTTSTLPKQKDIKPTIQGNSAIKVSQIVFASSVNASNLPVNSLNEVSLDQAGRVYCYTQIITDNIPQTIHHLWLDPSGQIFADIKLVIHNQPANTWSFINLSGQTAGQWTVKVIGSDGKLMATKSLLLK